VSGKHNILLKQSSDLSTSTIHGSNHSQSVYAWGSNKEGELSLAATQEPIVTVPVRV
jgi:hypothetical protein